MARRDAVHDARGAEPGEELAPGIPAGLLQIVVCPAQVHGIELQFDPEGRGELGHKAASPSDASPRSP